MMMNNNNSKTRKKAGVNYVTVCFHTGIISFYLLLKDSYLWVFLYLFLARHRKSNNFIFGIQPSNIAVIFPSSQPVSKISQKL